MSDSETTRPSRRLEVFGTACREILDELDAIGLPLSDYEGRRLRHEAAQLVMIFDQWVHEAPDRPTRTLAINRVTALYQALRAWRIVRAIIP